MFLGMRVGPKGVTKLCVCVLGMFSAGRQVETHGGAPVNGTKSHTEYLGLLLKCLLVLVTTILLRLALHRYTMLFVLIHHKLILLYLGRCLLWTIRL